MSTKNATATSHVINVYFIKTSIVSEEFLVVNAQLHYHFCHYEGWYRVMVF